MAMMSRPFRRLLAAPVAAVSLSLLSLAHAADPTPLDRAQSAFARGDYATAEKEADSAKGADHAKALLLKVKIQLKTGRYADAEKTAKTLGALGKENKILAAPYRAEALASVGKMAEALAVVKEVESEDTAHRARLVQGELLLRTGKRTEATPVFRKITGAYNNDEIKDTDPELLAIVARATHMLRAARQANDMFKKAERVGAKKMAEPMLWWADLFFEKYDPGDAGSTIKDALKVAP
jgi:tetratricopeptide (TPR) repeat protein